MNTGPRFGALVIAVFLCAGCAVSPEVENRRQAIEADIAEILSLSMVADENAESRRCLSEHEYRHFRPLGDRYILFEGRRDQLWINTLHGRCTQLRHGDVLVMRPMSTSRMCERDRFEVADWFDWPWYRRWPWHWGTLGTGETCMLGKFQPVTEAQVDEIEALLEQW